jgi:hypothetical protein
MNSKYGLGKTADICGKRKTLRAKAKAKAKARIARRKTKKNKTIKRSKK